MRQAQDQAHQGHQQMGEAGEPFPETSAGAWACRRLDLGLQASRRRENERLLFQACRVWCSVTVAPENERGCRRVPCRKPDFTTGCVFLASLEKQLRIERTHSLGSLRLREKETACLNLV